MEDSIENLINGYIQEFRAFKPLDDVRQGIFSMGMRYASVMDMPLSQVFGDITDHSCQRIKLLSTKSSIRIKIGCIALLLCSFEFLSEESKQEKVRVIGNYLSIFEDHHFGTKTMTEYSELHLLIDLCGDLTEAICSQSATLTSVFVDYELTRSLHWIEKCKSEVRCYSAVLIISKILIKSPDQFLMQVEKFFSTVWRVLVHQSKLVRLKSATCLKLSFRVLLQRKPQIVSRHCYDLFLVAYNQIEELIAAGEDQNVSQSGSRGKAKPGTLFKKNQGSNMKGQYMSQVKPKDVRFVDGALTVFLELIELATEVALDTSFVDQYYFRIVDCIWNTSIRRSMNASLKEKVIQILPKLFRVCPTEKQSLVLKKFFCYLIVCCQGDLYGFSNIEEEYTRQFYGNNFLSMLRPAALISLGNLFSVCSIDQLDEHILACLKMIRAILMQHDNLKGKGSDALLVSTDVEVDFFNEAIMCFAQITQSKHIVMAQHKLCLVEVELTIPLLFCTGVSELSVFAVLQVYTHMDNFREIIRHTLLEEIKNVLLKRKLDTKSRERLDTVDEYSYSSGSSSGNASFSKSSQWFNLREGFPKFRNRNEMSPRNSRLSTGDHFDGFSGPGFKKIEWKLSVALFVLKDSGIFNIPEDIMSCVDMIESHVLNFAHFYTNWNLTDLLFKCCILYFKLVVQHELDTAVCEKIFACLFEIGTREHDQKMKGYLFTLLKKMITVLKINPDCKLLNSIKSSGTLATGNMYDNQFSLFGQLLSVSDVSTVLLKSQVLSNIFLEININLAEQNELSFVLKNAALFLLNFDQPGFCPTIEVFDKLLSMVTKNEESPYVEPLLFLSSIISKEYQELQPLLMINCEIVLNCFLKVLEISDEITEISILCKGIYSVLRSCSVVFNFKDNLLPNLYSILLQKAEQFYNKKNARDIFCAIVAFGTISPNILTNGEVKGSLPYVVHDERSSSGLYINGQEIKKARDHSIKKYELDSGSRMYSLSSTSSREKFFIQEMFYVCLGYVASLDTSGAVSNYDIERFNVLISSLELFFYEIQGIVQLTVQKCLLYLILQKCEAFFNFLGNELQEQKEDMFSKVFILVCALVRIEEELSSALVDKFLELLDNALYHSCYLSYFLNFCLDVFLLDLRLERVYFFCLRILKRHWDKLRKNKMFKAQVLMLLGVLQVSSIIPLNSLLQRIGQRSSLNTAEDVCFSIYCLKLLIIRCPELEIKFIFKDIVETGFKVMAKVEQKPDKIDPLFQNFSSRHKGLFQCIKDTFHFSETAQSLFDQVFFGILDIFNTILSSKADTAKLLRHYFPRIRDIAKRSGLLSKSNLTTAALIFYNIEVLLISTKRDIPVGEYELNKKQFVIKTDSSTHFGREELYINKERLAKAWGIPENPSATDWYDWLERARLESIRESPYSVIRNFATVAQQDKKFCSELFSLSFLALWIVSDSSLKQSFLVPIEAAMSSLNLNSKFAKALLDLLEFMELNDQGLPIDLGLISKLAYETGFIEIALYYKEIEFTNYPAESIGDLIRIYNKAGLLHAADSLVTLAEESYAKRIGVKPELYMHVKKYSKALKIYAKEVDFELPETISGFHKMLLCLQKLGEYEVAIQLGLFGLRVYGYSLAGNFLLKKPSLDTVRTSFATPSNISSIIAQSTTKSISSETEDNIDLEVSSLIQKKIEESLQLLHKWDIDDNTSAIVQRNSVVQSAVAEKSILQLTPYIDESIDSLVESISRVSITDSFYRDIHPHLLKLQVFSEMKESVDILGDVWKREVVQRSWKQRLLVMRKSVDEIFPILLNRSFMLSVGDDEDSWLWFAKLCVKRERIRLALRCFMSFGLKYNIDGISSMNNILFMKDHFENYGIHEIDLVSQYVDIFPKSLLPTAPGAKVSCTALYQFLKLSWSLGEHKEAMERLKRLILLVAHDLPIEFSVIKHSNMDIFARDAQCVSVNISTQRKYDMTSKMLCRLANWTLQLDLLSYKDTFLVTQPFDRRISSIVTLGKARNKLKEERLSTCIEWCRNAIDLRPDYYKGWHSYALLNYRLATEFSPMDKNKVFIKCLKGFYKSLELHESVSKSVVQNLLRVLSIWFSNSHVNSIAVALEEGFERVSQELWLHVLPQLVAKLGYPGDLISKLLLKISKQFPHELVYPLAVAMSSDNHDRIAAAKLILDSVRKGNTKLVEEAVLVSEELVRIAVLWEERWASVLEESARLYFGGERNVDAMLALLLPLHEQLVRGPSSMNEVVFFQRYAGKLQLAAEWLQEYIARINAARRGVNQGFSSLRSQNLRTEYANGGRFFSENKFENYLNQAWDYYHQCFQSISSQLNFEKLVLSYISPRLTKLNNLDLRIPKKRGTRLIRVGIRSFSSSIKVYSSKQRPRVLGMMGSDGREYQFLLKGHEDLRLDERLMQLFNLVNNIFSADKTLSPVKCYSVTPLSRTVGIMEFVPRTLTLHEIVTQFREKRNIPLNIENNLVQERTDSYDTLSLWEKLEIFENIESATSGLELKKSFWLNSQTAEEWLIGRNKFTNTLSSMSMVGYVIGLGDRHPSNIMVENDIGSIMHIDFGDCFEFGMKREKYPETIPFRMTRMIRSCLDLGGVDGMFKYYSLKVIKLLRDNSESIITLLEAFVYDPLMNWKVSRHSKVVSKSDNLYTYTSDIGREWGANSFVPSSTSQKSSIEEEERNALAFEILQRVKDKLSGSDCLLGAGRQWDGSFVCLTPEEQLQRLNELATSRRELCSLYFGWCPFW